MSKIHKALQKAEQEALTAPALGFTPPAHGLVVEGPRPAPEAGLPRTLDDTKFPLAALTSAARECLQVPPSAAEEFQTL
ncbi:MAG: hypothetical protein ABR599_06375, partial [Gemmatimonadota bacterium]